MTATQRGPKLSRRQFLPRAAAVAAGAVAAGAVGYELPHRSSPPAGDEPSSTPPTTATAASGRVQTFLTRPDLRPPEVRVTQFGRPPAPGSTPRFILLAPMNAVPASDPQQGLMMLDPAGSPRVVCPGVGRPQVQPRRAVLRRQSGADVVAGIGVQCARLRIG